ncbi:MAG: dTDP-4-dehydrorhamnose reductase [Bdellovibrionota bacterium]|nr:dTDP-4-dehydrorhamnose reductase [Bdellovibrionota bacterium]
MIIVTGAMGQLGLCLKSVLPEDTVFLSREKLDLTNKESLAGELSKYPAKSIVINTGAYTDVDKAEENMARAYEVNSEAVGTIAEICQKFGLRLIHISTDYVFDGSSFRPISEEDEAKPIGVYGKSKLSGEVAIKECSGFSQYIIIRTSWLYSEYGNNFLKTMIKLSNRKSIEVVSDQIGTPTYAGDLAEVIANCCESFDSLAGEVYHYSNEGVASWYDFAFEIMEKLGSHCTVTPIPSEDFPTLAKRPHYSVFNKTKIKSKLKIEIPHWKKGLGKCLRKLSY